jgi:hypothetical protein
MEGMDPVRICIGLIRIFGKQPAKPQIHAVFNYGPLRASKVFATRYQFYLETKYDMVMLPENR